MNIQLEDKIGSIVTTNYKAAAIFKANGIDFCCRGNRSLSEAIQEKGLQAEDIIKELSLIETIPIEKENDFDHWSLVSLIDHIEKTHHHYIRQQIPVITEYLEKIVKVHGRAHPVLGEINDLFAEGSKELLKHLEAEECIVFPMIRDLVSAPLDMASPSCVPLNFFQQMISSMENDHTEEGLRWGRIATLTEEYQMHVGCNVAHVTFALLKEFQDDLHLHIHLENNILFPRAVEIKHNKIKAMQS